MNNHDNFGYFLRQVVAQSMLEGGFGKAIQESIAQGHKGSERYRQLVECNSTIKTAITDVDMLLFRIDMALDAKDKLMFDLLVQELGELV